jgi:hypothetical protein
MMTGRETVKALVLILLTAILLLSGASGLSAAPPAISLGQLGSVEFMMPDDWRREIIEGAVPWGTTVRLEPGAGAPLLLIMTAVRSEQASPREQEEAARQVADRIAQRAREMAVEPELPLQELSGSGVRAWYVSFTDKAVAQPSPDRFKYVDQGSASVGPLVMTFTLLSNDRGMPERARALEIIRSAHFMPPGAPWWSPSGAVAVTYPGRGWRLVMDLPGYEMEPARLVDGGRRIRLAGRNPDTGMEVMISLEESPVGQTAADHRDEALKKIREGRPVKMEVEDIRTSERDGMALLEYRVPSFLGVAVNQKSLSVFLARDGVKMEVRISKANFAPGETAYFERPAASLRFEKQEAGR